MSKILAENVCVICKQAQDSAQNLTGDVLLVNSTLSCSHKFCKICVEREFARKRQFSCPVCLTIVKRNTLSEKTLDEIEVDKDAQIRRKIKKIYNKTELDFLSVNDFRNYEEEVEDIIYNLVHGIDENLMNEKVALYEEANKSIMLENRARKDIEDRDIYLKIKQDEKEKEILKFSILERDAKIKANKREYKKQMEEVMIDVREKVTIENPADIASSKFSRFMDISIAPDSTVLVPNRAQLSDYLSLVSRRPEPKPMIKAQDIENKFRNDQDKSYSFDNDLKIVGGFKNNLIVVRNFTEFLTGINL